MEMSEEEQRLRLSGTIPSVEGFWEYRLGSSAVCVTLAVNEYVNLIRQAVDTIENAKPAADGDSRYAWGDMQLPRSIMEDTNMKLVWDRTNIIVSV